MTLSCDASAAGKRGSRLGGGGDVALVLVLERERQPGRMCTRRCGAERTAEVEQGLGRIGLAPVAKRADDRCLERGPRHGASVQGLRPDPRRDRT
jgi:hypothetical protein